MNTDTTTRYTWLDATRGAAALSVVFAHSLAHMDTGANDVFAFGRFGVALFFIASGYVVAKSLQSRSLRSFWQRRFWRLYPAFWFAMLVYLATGLSGTYQPLDLVVNATMIPGLLGVPYVFGVFWSLSAEMVWYALASIGLSRARLLLLVPIVAMPLLFFLPDPVRMAALLPLFAIGAAYWHGNRRVLLLSIIAALPFAWITPYASEVPAYFTAVALWALVYWRRHTLICPRWLVWCGTISYSLYLLHYAVILAVPAPPLLALPIWTAGSLLLAWLSYRYAERPLMHGITARRTTPQPSPQ
jgi:peptidoglycan/LPS O-acetylase OafA/YrhL